MGGIYRWRVQFKLKKIRKFLKGWGFNRAGNKKKRKREINEELDKLEKRKKQTRWLMWKLERGAP
jgi:DNA-binding transcriptional MerR regulator